MRYALSLFESAHTFFRPGGPVSFHLLPGRPGWPAATMFRYHVLLNTFPQTDYVFLTDADMRFESLVGPEVLGDGMTATKHPGYVNQPRAAFPYETDGTSAAWIHPDRGETYYCGGFVGGDQRSMRRTAAMVKRIIDDDQKAGHVPVWHDESALNKVLVIQPPAVTLPPSYCYPDHDDYYRGIWSEQYERKLVAIDKTAEERGDR